MAVFIGVTGLLAIMLGVGWGTSTLAGATPVKDTSLTVSQRAGSAAGPGGQALAVAARPGPPKRVGAGPKLPRGARRLGALAPATRINVDVMLAPGDAAGLAAYAANVSSPGNSLYHHYLPIAQLAAAFSTSFDQYQLASGRVAFANTTAPLFSGAAAPTSRPSSALTPSPCRSPSACPGRPGSWRPPSPPGPPGPPRRGSHPAS